MKQKFFTIRTFLVYIKLWIQRTMSWIAMINAAILLFLFLAKLQDYGVYVYITKWYFPIFAAVLILMIFIGYLEDKAGFYQEESHEAAKRNPYFSQIIKRLDKIEKKLDKK